MSSCKILEWFLIQISPTKNIFEKHYNGELWAIYFTDSSVATTLGLQWQCSSQPERALSQTTTFHQDNEKAYNVSYLRTFLNDLMKSLPSHGCLLIWSVLLEIPLHVPVPYQLPADQHALQNNETTTRIQKVVSTCKLSPVHI